MASFIQLYFFKLLFNSMVTRVYRAILQFKFLFANKIIGILIFPFIVRMIFVNALIPPFYSSEY